MGIIRCTVYFDFLSYTISQSPLFCCSPVTFLLIRFLKKGSSIGCLHCGSSSTVGYSKCAVGSTGEVDDNATVPRVHHKTSTNLTLRCIWDFQTTSNGPQHTTVNLKMVCFRGIEK